MGKSGREYKEKMNYDNAVVLPAVNDVRKARSNGMSGWDELKALMEVIPTDVRERVKSDTSDLAEKYNRQMGVLNANFNSKLGKTVDHPWENGTQRGEVLDKYDSKVQSLKDWFVGNKLEFTIRHLEKVGLLRSYREVEEGSV